MSADNGIYIVKFPEGYRVTEAQAIENIDLHRKGTKSRKRMLKSYFGNSEVYKKHEQTVRRAEELYNEILNDDFYGICEYGICDLGEYESFE